MNTTLPNRERPNLKPGTTAADKPYGHTGPTTPHMATAALATRTLSLDTGHARRDSANAWRIAALLQTSLDVRRVVELFAGELAARIPYDSFSYQHAGKDIEVRVGRVARHSLSYQLIFGEEHLGEMMFTRARRFDSEEVDGIENYAAGLMYALHNALLYREAVDSANRDPLTGVANRAGLDLALERELGLGRRQGLPLSALLFDVDKFKHINDRFGHAVGDQVLGALAKEVQESIRSSDILARTGGEEFVLVLPGTDSDGAALLAERLCQRIAALRCEILSGDRKERIGFTVSVGAATWNGQEDAGALIHRADLAMYSAKQLGGNRIGVAETLVAAS